MIIPNMVAEVVKEFGLVTCSMLGNNGPEPIDNVLGLRKVDTMLHVLKYKSDASGNPLVEDGHILTEISSFPSVLLLCTNAIAGDITFKLLDFTENLCEISETLGKLGHNPQESADMSIETNVKDTITYHSTVNKDDITLISELKEDLDLDSLDLMEIAMSLEDDHDIEIHAEQFETLVTVGDIVTLVTAYGKEVPG